MALTVTEFDQDDADDAGDEADHATQAGDSYGLSAPSPSENPDLFGHAATEVFLLDAMRRGQLHHGILLSGKTGIGKATLAWRLARFVLAVQPGIKMPPPAPEVSSVNAAPPAPTPAPPAPAPSLGLGFDLPEMLAPTAAVPKPAPPPEKSAPILSPDLATAENLSVAADFPVMRRISARTHRDLFVIERQAIDPSGKRATSQISVEQVRELGAFMQLRPSEGQWRVVIIDAIDDFTPNAQNALLKLLEEPSPHCLILVVNHVAARMLPTLRSRCQKLVLSPLSDGDMRRGLSQFGVRDPRQIDLAIRLGEGSLGRALTMLNGGVHEFYQDFLTLLALPDLGAVSQTAARHQFAERIAATNSRRAAKISDEAAPDLFSHFCELWPRLLTRIIAAAARGSDFAAQSPAESAAARHLQQKLGLYGLTMLWEKSTSLLNDANRLALDRKQVVLEILAAAQGG